MMRSTVIFLGSFVLLVSVLGLVVPNSAALQFMFPRDAVCIITIVLVLPLLALVLPAWPFKRSTLMIVRSVAAVTLVVTLLRLVLPSSIGFAGVISHTDLFAIAPTGLAYAAASVRDEPRPHK